VITDPLTLNRYVYVNGDPLNLIDPSGHMEIVNDAGGTPGPYVDKTAGKSASSSCWINFGGYNPCEHASAVVNAISQVANIRPTEAQDNLIALGNSMDDGWKQRYRDTLQGSGEWVDGTRSDLVSGDPYRVLRGTAGVVLLSSNFVPGAGEGIAASEDVGRVGLAEVMDHPGAVEQVASDGEHFVQDAAETCAVNSFAAGTLVLMADGTKKPIDRVRPGEWVMAGDPQRGIKRPEPVQVVITGHGLKHLYDVHVDGEVVEATYNHPFWVVEKQAFVWAQDLVPGEHLLLADGRAPPIESIFSHDETMSVYNLSIANIHTFYVGSSSALVHNSCGPTLQQLREAAANYPNKVGDELHHVVPKYLGGPANGPLVKLPASYHQVITNAFREEWAYGQARPTLGQLSDILGRVYSRFPIGLP
jgi:hypothetical protein